MSTKLIVGLCDLVSNKVVNHKLNFQTRYNLHGCRCPIIEADFAFLFQAIAKTITVLVNTGKIKVTVLVIMLVTWLKIARNPAINVVEVDPQPQVLVPYIFENKNLFLYDCIFY